MAELLLFTSIGVLE